jgi:hypothetical protein
VSAIGFDAPRWAMTMENATVEPTTASTRSFTATTSNGATAGGGNVVVGAEVVVEGASMAGGVAGGGTGATVVVAAGAGAVMVTPATLVGTSLIVVRVGFFVVLVTRFTVVFVARFNVVEAFGPAEAPDTPDDGIARNVTTDIATSVATDRRTRPPDQEKRDRSTPTIVSRTGTEWSDCPMRA